MFIFGKKSASLLATTHPDLQKVAKEALSISKVDFGIIEGRRSVDKQTQYVKAGLSQTMKSRHLTGHAIDCIPFVDGKFDDKTEDNFTIMAEAFREAAIKLEIEILWGRAWLMALNYYPSAQAAMDAYVAKRRAEHRTPFMDGPHFQLTFRQYPE